MKGYIFDPSRLAGSVRQQRKRGETTVARMLRDYLSGDPLAEFRARAQRDPRLQEQLAGLAEELATAQQRRGQSTASAI